MEDADEIIRLLNLKLSEARDKSSKTLILQECLKGNQLGWFLNYRNKLRSNFDTVFATPCNLRFNRHWKGSEIFIDENERTSNIPDNIFDSYISFIGLR